MNFYRFITSTAVFLLSFISTALYSYDLPDLGDSSSSIVSREEEFITGQNWLRAFRRQAPINEDPLIYNYTHGLINELAFHSHLQEKYFSLVMVNSKDFNAFAVPGNVIGINIGLFFYAETEDQMASVISHELAHLSQRHYARSLEKQKSQSIATLAAFLGSMLIMAAGDSESGMAALATTQAAAISSQLKYSRTQEQEADRIGMETLANSDMNPEAIAHMFQHMLSTTRYRNDIKEFDFLLTHPMTDTRVADALNKARLLPKRNDRDGFNFHLMKARSRVLMDKNPAQSIQFFKDAGDSGKYPEANKYGLALAYIESSDLSNAKTLVDDLFKNNSHLLTFVILQADLLILEQKYPDAEKLLTDELALNPNNYPLTMKVANLLLKTNQPEKASVLLRSLANSGKPDTPDVWYLLAEIEGLAGHIPEVHMARAEYFVRLGALTQAQRHLYLAMPLLDKNLQAKSRVQLRINEIEKMKQQEQF